MSARSGSRLVEFLQEEGVYDEVAARALKAVLARQLSRLIASRGLTKAVLAERMHTSRSSLDRLLDPDNTSLTLNTLSAAAAALQQYVRIEFEDMADSAGTVTGGFKVYGVQSQSATQRYEVSSSAGT